MATVEVAFPGGKKVAAKVAGHLISTDQTAKNGGENEAPEPFVLFLASVATCAGIYAKSFCDVRDLPSPSGLDMDVERDSDGLLSRLDLVLHVDSGFPAKYEPAIIRSMEHCAVKRQLRDEIEVSTRIARSDGRDT